MEGVSLYNDTIRLTFNEGSHRYTVVKHVKDDIWTTPTPVTGVTSILSVINKPALFKYPMNKALEYLEAQLKSGKKWNAALVQEAKLAHVNHSDAGKKAGKVGHALVEALQAGKKVKLPSDPLLKKQAESVRKAYEAWKKDFEPEVVGAEQVIYSQAHNYAGTYDLLAKIDGRLVLADYKTTDPSYFNPDGIYPEYFAQLGAYSLAYEEMYGEVVDDLAIINLPKNGESYKVKTLKDIGLTKIDCQLYFLNALGLYELNKLFGWRING